MIRLPWRKPRNPARELAIIGVEQRRRNVKAVAQQIRRELNLPEHPALKADA
jgi:hypothetical protein